MASYSQAFDTLADDDTWMRVFYAAAAFMFAVLTQNVIEQQLGMDLPVDEAYGVIAIVAVNQFTSGDVQKYGTVGAGMHSVDALARRFGVRRRLVAVAGGS